ncbi:20441_t:CDS:2, partial [Cetraspora pellucida]
MLNEIPIQIQKTLATLKTQIERAGLKEAYLISDNSLPLFFEDLQCNSTISYPIWVPPDDFAILQTEAKSLAQQEIDEVLESIDFAGAQS